MRVRTRNLNYKLYRSILKKEHVIVFVLLIVCFGLRVCNFSSASIWGDEAYTMDLAHFSPGKIIKTSIHDINPPAYGLILHYWAKLFGYTEAGLRFFSVVCGFLTGLVLYKTGRKHFNFLTAFTSTLFYSFSNLQIYFSEEARCYAMVTLLCSLSIFYFLNYLKAEKITSLVLLIIVNSMVLYTHYVSGILFLAEGLVLTVYFLKKPKVIGIYIVSQIIVLATFLPWFWKAFANTNGMQVSWLPDLSIDLAYQFFLRVFNDNVILIAGSAFILISLVVLSIRRAKRKLKLHFIVLMLSIIPLSVICLSNVYFIKIFFDRYILFITVPMFVLLGYSIASIPINVAFKILIIGGCMYFLILTVKVDAFRNEAWKEVCTAGEVFVTPNSSIMLHPGYTVYPYQYYALRWAYINDYKNIKNYWTSNSIFPVYDTVEVKKIKGLLNDRLIFYSSHFWFNDNKSIENFILRDYNQIFFREYYGVRLYVYERKK